MSWAAANRGMVATFRRLARRPIVLLSGLTSLSIGIGATAALWAVLVAVAGERPELHHPEQLFRVTRTLGPGRPASDVLSQSLVELISKAGIVNAVAAEVVASGVTGEWVPRVVEPSGRRASAVTIFPGYFTALGVTLDGRDFQTTDDAVVILSARTARRIFGSRSPVGEELRLSGHSVRVAGVVRGSFRGLRIGDDTDVWVPFGGFRLFSALPPGVLGIAGVRAVVRLPPATRSATASARLAETSGQPLVLRDMVSDLYPEAQSRAHVEDRRTAAVLTLASAAILLLGLINIAALLGAHHEAQRRDRWIRTCLGASPGAVRLLAVSDALTLGSGATLLGVAVSRGLAVGLSGIALPSGVSLALVATTAFDDIRRCGLLGAACTIVLVGLAWRQAGESLMSRPTSGRVSPRGRGRMLTASYAALATASAILALLLGRSADAASRRPLGFDLGSLLDLSVQPSVMSLTSVEGADPWEMRAVRYRLLLAELGRQSFVESVAMGGLPLRDPMPVDVGPPMRLRFADGDGREVASGIRYVGAAYPGTVGLKIVRGRELARHDEIVEGLQVGVATPAVAIQAGGEDIVGRTVIAEDGRQVRIVGVTSEVYRLDRPRTPVAMIYAASDVPRTAGDSQLALVIRSRQDPQQFRDQVERTVRAVFDEPASLVIRTGPEVFARYFRVQRFTGRIALWLAGYALVLVWIGVTGMVGTLVAQRRRELATRKALGATPLNLLAVASRPTLVPLALGFSLGSGLAWTTSRLLSSSLLGLEWNSAAPYLGVGLLLIGGALGAAAGVSRRARHEAPARYLKD